MQSACLPTADVIKEAANCGGLTFSKARAKCSATYRMIIPAAVTVSEAKTRSPTLRLQLTANAD
jgi:hypothetical protein